MSAKIIQFPDRKKEIEDQILMEDFWEIVFWMYADVKRDQINIHNTHDSLKE